MKKSILNLGIPIPKKSQQSIFGGTGFDECGYGTCSGGQICYRGTNGNYCSDSDPNAITVEPPEDKKMPIYGDGG